MIPVQREKIRQIVREIEMLLGPSFSCAVFARALLHELRLTGIKSDIVQSDQPYCVKLIANAFELFIQGPDNVFTPEHLVPGQGLWIPHKFLLLPTTKQAQVIC